LFHSSLSSSLTNCYHHKYGLTDKHCQIQVTYKAVYDELGHTVQKQGLFSKSCD